MINGVDEAELEALLEGVAQALPGVRGPFLDNVLILCLRRYEPLASARDQAEDEEGLPPVAELPGGRAECVEFLCDCAGDAMASPFFEELRKCFEDNDSQAFEGMMKTLDSQLRLRGIFYRHGLDPENEYPGIWGRVWEAIPKWDGRNFRAYVARIARNYCLDEIARKKRNPTSIDEMDPTENRPQGQTSQSVSRRDAIALVAEVLADLEESGRIKSIDFVIFALVCQGRPVAEIVETLNTAPAFDSVRAALEFMRAKRCKAEHAVALGAALDGLTASELATVCDLSPAAAEGVVAACAGLGDEDLELARLIGRVGMTTADLSRARSLTSNAINLCLNRIRLKLWMAMVDRAYEAVRARGRIDEVDLAIVDHRCTVTTNHGCRMYKDATCKREADPAEIARLGGLDLQPSAVKRRMDDLRLKIVEEGLGMVYPDYNACLTERKPQRASK
ncbi:MAG: sigma-70 family RNA polymerase sigma factor [Planctomycetes bacterium]|nr:sigma-70 family RNA polymerase sigma factor [Planctomycetota bacterium]